MTSKTGNVMTGAQIRRQFIDYFISKGHKEVASSPLVPSADDATLLFTNAGMVQFKDLFLGREKRNYTRATTSQKCLRVSGKHNDLEAVGRTARHQTFFEMLGNFSFGDYFKELAIEYGWEFLTQTVGLPEEKLYVSVYTDDDEAALIWERNMGVPPEKIVRFGEKDNFWSMGDTGPCGPCSEIHYDRGEEHRCDNPECGIDCECDRYLELWNLVFMQFNRDQSGAMEPLANASIDTGLGLERLASVVQGKQNNFDTDLIHPVIAHMGRMTDVVYGANPQTDVSFRVIGDHSRATAFLIADGIHPSNEGRGYVLRRILRRALRHGWMLGVKKPFAHRLTETVIEIMKDAYPELVSHANIIRESVHAEEKSFLTTLEHGMPILSDMIETAKSDDNTTIPGASAFKLYDTYGFPLDLAAEIAQDANVAIDMNQFNELMEGQKEKGRQSWKGADLAGDNGSDIDYGKTEFKGYEAEEVDETAIRMIVKGGGEVATASAGDVVELALESSPFYAESGGQVSDVGEIWSDSFRAEVTSVEKRNGEQWVHHASVVSGEVNKGDKASARIDIKRRDHIRRNHSATHLLHSALRTVLGDHIKQAGSQVAPERLRFDYNHYKAPEEAEVATIERMVNEKIMENIAVSTKVMNTEQAIEAGAMALFGEKYGDNVRVVNMGDFSTELCGGTHTRATGDIGFFKIASESGIAAGVRRIEAVTGSGALEYTVAQDNQLALVADALKSTKTELPEKVKKQVDRVKELEKENRKLREKLISGQAASSGDMLSIEEKIDDITMTVQELEGVDAESIRAFIDNQKNRIGANGVVVAGAKDDGKVLLAVGVTKDLTGKVHAGKVIKQVASIAGGGGGGRPDFAQAGGKKPEKLKEALEAAPGIVKKLLEG